jgi:hypothetical protein
MKVNTQIYITEQDIAAGARFSTKKNPVCLAIARVYNTGTGWNVEVFSDQLSFTKKGFRKRSWKFDYKNPKLAKFLFAFHSGEKVKPFRTQIYLPG